MKRIYMVEFDTQRNRRYITWGLFVMAQNQREAKWIAEDFWYISDKCPYRPTDRRPHMFHTTAKRVSEEDRCRDFDKFFKIEERYANWG